MDEVSIIVLDTECGFYEPTCDDASGVLAATWSDRWERDLGDPTNPLHLIRHLDEVEKRPSIRNERREVGLGVG